MDTKQCEPDRVCFPVNTLIGDEYYIVCQVCKEKWKWKLDDEGLAEFSEKYGIS